MLNRFINGLCLIILAVFAFKDYWKAAPISAYTLVGAHHAQERSLLGKGAIVAVLDEGFDSSHPFLEKKFSSLHRYTTANTSRDISESLIFKNGEYVFESHGTHVTGIISKLAPQAEIIPIKVESFGGDQSFVKALELAAHSPARVVNISMRLSYTGREMSPNVRNALLKLAQAGKLIVIAAGNESSPLMKHAYTASLAELSNNPLMNKQLILVGASSYKNGVESLAEFSNYPGCNPMGSPQNYFISAPGDDITSTLSGGFFGKKSGTSMAAPMVTAIASILIGAYPHLNAENISSLLLKSARKNALDGKALPSSQFGAGILNLSGALNKVN